MKNLKPNSIAERIKFSVMMMTVGLKPDMFYVIEKQSNKKWRKFKVAYVNDDETALFLKISRKVIFDNDVINNMASGISRKIMSSPPKGML